MHPRWTRRFSCPRCKVHITLCNGHYTFFCIKASACVAPRANSFAIHLSSRLASPAPRRSRCSRGFIHGLLAAIVDKIPPAFERRCIRAGRFALAAHAVKSTLHYVMATIHFSIKTSLCVAPRANSFAIHLSSRLASPAPRRSRCSRGFIHGLLAAIVDKIPPAFERRCIRAGRFALAAHAVKSTLHYVMATIHFSIKTSLCVAPRANSFAIHLSSRLASPAPRRSRCSRGFIHGLLAARWPP